MKSLLQKILLQGIFICLTCGVWAQQTPKATTVLTPLDDVEGAEIFSSLDVKKENAKLLFRFQITDKGDDGLPTKVKIIHLEKASAFSQKYLFYLLGGILVKNSGKMIAQITSLSYANARNSLDIVLPNRLIVADGTSEIVEIWGFVSTHDKLAEGEVIALKIPQIHGCVTETDGSGLEPRLSNEIVSSEFDISVVATSLQFVSVPSKVYLNSSFQVEVQAVDIWGHLDVNYTGKMILEREGGTGILSSADGFSRTAKGGKSVWNFLSYDKVESITLSVVAEGFQRKQSQVILVEGTDSELLMRSQGQMNKKVSSLAISPQKASNIFAFAVRDHGEADDKPTVFTRMLFENTVPQNSIDWEQSIAGAVLMQDGEVVATTEKVTNESIQFSSKIMVENGTTSEFVLAIYCRQNNVQDNRILRFQIPADLTGWKFATTSSSVQMPKTLLSSETILLDIKWSQPDFLSIPYVLEESETSFSVTVGARDIYGNIDVDAQGSVSIKVGRQEYVQQWKQGIVHFLDLKREGNKDFEVVVAANSKQVVHHISVGKKKVLLEADFEKGKLDNWKNAERWKASGITPIRGKFSLKHNLVNVSGESAIVRDLGSQELTSGTTVWRWQMKNGDWNPSSTNTFYCVLRAERSTLAGDGTFVVGVNFVGSDDRLTLWRVEGEKAVPLIVSPFKWNNNNLVGIEVVYSHNGQWSLSYDNNGGFDNLYLVDRIKYDAFLDGVFYTGIVFRHKTASRAGKLWVDDIATFYFENSPFIKSVQAISATEIEVSFSQKMNEEAASNRKNYMLNGQQVKKIEQLEVGDKVRFLEEKLNNGENTLKIINLKGANGKYVPDTTVVFNYFPEVNFGNVVFNELMIDELPSEQLPEVEYIELFNNSAIDWSVAGWRLQVNENLVVLPLDTIRRNEYLLLCNITDTALLKSYGHVLGLSKFPALSNDGATISLSSQKGSLIDKLTYKKEWNKDATKREGGWSLERVDVDAPSAVAINWTVSTDMRGGTPGEKNAVVGTIIDETSPKIVQIIPVSDRNIQVFFDEQIDTLAVSLANFDLLSSENRPESIVVKEEGKILELIVEKALLPNTSYQLRIQNIIDLFGNVSVSEVVSFMLPTIPKKGDILINELLFNPVPGNVDYIELYNNSDMFFDLSDLFIALRDTKRGELSQACVMSKTPCLFPPKSFVVLTKSPNLVQEQYEVKYPKVLHELACLPNFPDDQGTVVIGSKDNIVEEWTYTEDMHFGMLTTKEGISLERIHYAAPTGSSSNWHSAATTIGGTPSYQNSMYKEKTEIDGNWSVLCKVFSPNSDGVNDFMQLQYSLEGGGWVANIRIFDSNGHWVKDLIRNEMLPQSGTFSWDGTDENKQLCRTGRYIIFVEMFDENGTARQYKKTCVLYRKTH